MHSYSLALRVSALIGFDGTSGSDQYDAVADGKGLTTNIINGLEGDDLLLGGYLADTIDGGTGDDTLYGRDGDDELTGGEGNDMLHGDAGNDTLYGNMGNDFLEGGAGDDFIYTGSGDDSALGGTGDDIFHLGGGTNEIYCGQGDDLVRANIGIDTILGGSGEDTVDYSMFGGSGGLTVNLITGKGKFGAADGDTYRSIEDVIGSNGDDFLIGNGAYNTIDGSGGDDLISGGFGGDDLDGGLGFDLLDYSESIAGVKIDLAANTASGGDAQGDTIQNFEDVVGSAFDDLLFGTDGANSLIGLDGKDVLYGAEGVDSLKGGAGADKFVFKAVTDSGVTKGLMDVIEDFSSKQGDKIELSAIDANAKKGGNQAFHLIGTQGFHGKAGELRYEKTVGHTVIYGDVNGDKVADFAISLSVSVKMTDAMFFL